MVDAQKIPFDRLQKEAEQGNAQAQYYLANAYYNGNGVARNAAEGAKRLLKAAEQGHIQAQCDSGVMYQKGNGVTQSYQDTLKWYRMAAEQGDALAQHNLGSLNAKGFRINGMGFFTRTGFAFMKATQDFVEAYKWFSLAAARGHNRSLKDRSIIKRRMWGTQITKAEELVKEFERSRK
jgi:TPR repeat protein